MLKRRNAFGFKIVNIVGCFFAAIYFREKRIKSANLSASLGNGGSDTIQITLAVDGVLASTIKFLKKNNKKKVQSLAIKKWHSRCAPCFSYDCGKSSGLLVSY